MHSFWKWSKNLILRWFSKKNGDYLSYVSLSVVSMLMEVVKLLSRFLESWKRAMMICNVVLTLWSQFSYWYDVGDNNRITSSKTMSSSFTYLLYMICAVELLPPRRQVSSEVSKQSSLAILGPSGRNLDEMKTGLKRLK